MDKSINIDLAETKFVALQVSAYEQQTFIHNILSNEALSNLIQPNPGSVPMSPNSPINRQNPQHLVTDGIKLLNQDMASSDNNCESFRDSVNE